MASRSSSPASEPTLTPQGDYVGRPPLRIEKAVVVVGSADGCHLHLVSSSVSRHHALLIRDRDGVYVRDLASRTKVVVNGQPQRETLLQNEDEIHIGKFSFRYSIPAAAIAPASAVSPAQFMINGAPAKNLPAGRTLLIGKGEGCDISVNEEPVSSRHAIIFTAKGKRYIRDLDSRAGTFVNGEKIHQQEFHLTDKLRVGSVTVTLAEPGKPAEAERDIPVQAKAPPIEPAVEPEAIEPEVVAVAPMTQPVAEAPIVKLPPVTETPILIEPKADTTSDDVDRAVDDLGLDFVDETAPVEGAPIETPSASREAPAEKPRETPAAASAIDPVDLALAEAGIETGGEEIPLSPETAATTAEAAAPLEPAESVLDDTAIDLEIDAIPLEPAAKAPVEPEPVVVSERPARPAEPIAAKPAAPEPITVEPLAEKSSDDLDFALEEIAADLIKKPEPVAEEAAPAPAAGPAMPAASAVDPVELALAEAGVDLAPEAVAEPVPAPEPVPVAEAASVEAKPIELEKDSRKETGELDLAIDDLGIDFNQEPAAAEAVTPTGIGTPVSSPEPAAKTEIDPVDFALEEAGVDLVAEAVPGSVEPEPAAHAREAAVETPSNESVSPTADESPIAEVTSEISVPLPEPQIPVVESIAPPESAADISFDLHLDSVGSDTAETPGPAIELSPVDLSLDEPGKPAMEEEKVEAAEETLVAEAPAEETPAPEAPSPEAAPADETAETTRQRPARGRKAAPKAAKPPKAPRAKSKRQPPKTAVTADEIPVEPETISASSPVDALASAAAGAVSLSATDEIVEAIISGDGTPVVPSVSIQPQAPEIIPAAESELPDVAPPPMDLPDIALPAEEILIRPEAEVAPPVEEPPQISESIEAPMTVPDVSLQPAAEWDMNATAAEDIGPAIVSEDQTPEARPMPFEPSISDSPPPIAADLAASNLSGALDSQMTAEPAAPEDLLDLDSEIDPEMISPPPMEKIAPPVVRSEVQFPHAAAAPPVPGPPAEPPAVTAPSISPPVVRPPSSQYIAPVLTSIGGLGFVGGGTVNLDHFLGGQPITLPELPPTPAGFGRVRFDMSGPPLPSFFPSVPLPPASPPVHPFETPRAAAPAPPARAPIAETPVLETPMAAAPIAAPQVAPPGPVQQTTPRPATPHTPPPAPTAAPIPPKAPPVSFSAKAPPKPPEAAGAGARFPAARTPGPKRSTAFEGLAMGAAFDGDIFADDRENPPINDAVFGGASTAKTDEFFIPESEARAGRAGQTPEKDFAEDDFWNRTDGENGGATTPPAASPSAAPASIPDPAKLPAVEIEEESPIPAESVSDDSPLVEPSETAELLKEESTEELPAQMPMDESGESNLNAATGSKTIPEAPRPAKRRRFRIPFLMPIIALGTLVGAAAIWKLMPVVSTTQGTLTFSNFQFIPGTQEATEFEAAQRRLLTTQTDDQTRRRATEILSRDNPGVAAGFLDSPQAFAPVANSVSVMPASQSVASQTLLQLSFTGNDKDGDLARMLALLQALADRNATQVDANRRLQANLAQAQGAVVEAQQKLDHINQEIVDLAPVIESAPPSDQFAAMTAKKTALERNRLDAENAVNRDRADVARLSSSETVAPSTQPDVSTDPQLKQMRQQLADLTAEVDSARSDQLAGAAMARQKLQAASRQFDEQIDAANTLLGSESQLRQFVDSAMESQTKGRDLINMLIIDGEDLEQQLEDTRRDVEDLIQTQQAEKWAIDPQLQSLRENLDSAQHRYNANVGQGITDPRVLDPIQKEIDTYTAQVKQRQADLGADPAELRVQDSLNSIIDALRKKLAKEKHQTDEVLDPLQQQLANLDPVVAALPATQQDLARKIHDRLNALNEARQKYADTFGDQMIAPSAKVAELKNRIADLKADILAREADLQRRAIVDEGTQQKQDYAAAQVRLNADEANLEAATKSLQSALVGYDELHGRQVSAEAAQQKKMNLLDDRHSANAAVESAKRDADEKQSAADHAFAINPVTPADVTVSAPPDQRITYILAVLGGGFVAITLAAFFSHGGRGGQKSAGIASKLDSLVMPMNSDDDHAPSHVG